MKKKNFKQPFQKHNRYRRKKKTNNDENYNDMNKVNNEIIERGKTNISTNKFSNQNQEERKNMNNNNNNNKLSNISNSERNNDNNLNIEIDEINSKI